MEFGKHIGKGVWAFADKALPAVYGIGFIFLVVRELPQQEFGAFVIVQTLFTVVTTAAYALSLQPMIKFVSESDDAGPFIVASLTLQFLLFLGVSIVTLLLKGTLAQLFDPTNTVNLAALFNYLPLLLLVMFYRNFAVSFLQSKYRVQRIFWIDAMYFIGTLLGIYVVQQIGSFHTAEDMLNISVIMIACSSLLALVLTWNDMPKKFALRREAFSAMWHFGKYTFLGNAAYTLFSQMDTFFVTAFGGVVSAAIYNSVKVLTRIFDMLAQVLQMFLIPFSSKTYANQDLETLRTTAEKSICFSTILLLPVFLIMLFYPVEILHVFYNGKYDQGAPIVRAMAFLAFILPWNSVVSSYLVGMGKVKQVLHLSLVLLAVAFIAYAILTPTFGALGTGIGLVSTLLLITFLLVLYFQKFVALNIINVIKRTEDIWMFLKKKLL